jgi:hypothetical protein
MLTERNGTYIVLGSIEKKGSKRQCSVCCTGFGHDDDLELCEVTFPDGEKVMMWVCGCMRNPDCAFAYPGDWTVEEGRELAEKRKAYLRSQGIGIGAERKE